MTGFAFKELDDSNWLEPDDTMRVFGRLDPLEGPLEATGADWLRHILEPRLLEQVPQDVRALFEVARGAMAYGYFFYPLWTLASQQLYRVGEAAVRHKAASLGAPGRMSFAQGIDWLREHEVISEAERAGWDAVRRLRNRSSHPETQPIRAPAQAIRTLEAIAAAINGLFRSD